MTPFLADDDDEFTLIVELLGYLRLFDRLSGSDDGRRISDEKTRIFRQVRIVFVLGVAIPVVHANAPELLGRRYGGKQRQTIERVVRLQTGCSLARRIQAVACDQRP